MRLIASAGPSTLLPGLRRGPQLPARDLLHQSDRLARPSAGHPRPARGRAAGPDLRRLIQLLVVRCLSAAQLAPKADRTSAIAISRALMHKSAKQLKKPEIYKTLVLANPLKLFIFRGICAPTPRTGAVTAGIQHVALQEPSPWPPNANKKQRHRD